MKKKRVETWNDVIEDLGLFMENVLMPHKLARFKSYVRSILIWGSPTATNLAVDLLRKEYPREFLPRRVKTQREPKMVPCTSCQRSVHEIHPVETGVCLSCHFGRLDAESLV